MKSSHCLVLACLALAACGPGDVKEKLGLSRQAPDEFRVVSRPPLSVPPEFTMRPPSQGAEYVSGMPAQDRARDAVLGDPASARSSSPSSSTVRNLVTGAPVSPVTSGSLPGSADSQLLANAGAGKVDPQIRQKLLDDKLNGLAVKDSRYLFGGSEVSDPVVDATGEAGRIKQNQEKNASPSAGGETPVIKEKDRGLLGGLF